MQHSSASHDGPVPLLRTTVTVVVSGDQSLIRHGVATLLDAEADMEMCAEVAGHETVEAVRTWQPDVLLLECTTSVPATTGSLLRALIGPCGASGTSVVVVATADDGVVEALRAGARGFVLGSAEPTDLVSAVRAAARGETWIDPRVAGRVVAALARTSTVPAQLAHAVSRLTAREREVLCLMARGLSNAEITERLVLSEATVRTHVSRILSKTGMHARAGAIVLAYQCGLVDAGR